MEITPLIFFAGWLGVLSPAIMWAVASAATGKAAIDLWQPGIAVSFLALAQAWPAGCLGAAAARLERDRRETDWPLPTVDAVGGFVAGNLLTAGFPALILAA
ncbi:hypothetical protein CA12_21160 [Alienimonas californiensis]|uniref:Uncharacterized protein n=1 Tax=Alienimonas californiensis TaxID=2527989 RepID=A0A517P9H5_9PLAN|nr:hypothetical protein CA12_21160 [Alienimonas californiensis]